jgi:hypothetical protein
MPTILIARNHEQLVPEELFSAYRRRRIAFRHYQFIRVDMSTVSDGMGAYRVVQKPTSACGERNREPRINT